jgi:hypothetical protein
MLTGRNVMRIARLARAMEIKVIAAIDDRGDANRR